jgi:molybdopterin converting factor small subunit
MVKVIFYNLLRSKYGINEMLVQPGSITEIIKEIIDLYPQMKLKDFETSVVFHHGVPIHFRGFDKLIKSNEEIIFTHFVGGG